MLDTALRQSLKATPFLASLPLQMMPELYETENRHSGGNPGSPRVNVELIEGKFPQGAIYQIVFHRFVRWHSDCL